MKNLGIADPEFFIRVPLFDYQGWKISAQPLVKLPSLYENGDVPRAGSQSLDFEISALAGTNMKILDERDYIDVRAGYRERSRGLEAQFRIDVAYGIHLNENFSILPAARAIIAKDISVDQPFTQDGEQNFDLFRAELGLSYKLENSQTVTAIFFTHLQGANTGAGEGVTLGTAWQF